MLTHFLNEGEHPRPDHDMVDQVGIGGDLGEIFGVGGFRRRDGERRGYRAAVGGYRRAEKISVIIAEGVIRIDHRHVLAEVVQDPGGDALDLGADIGDARLEGVAVERSRGHVIALADHEIGRLQLARPRRRAVHHMGEQGAEDEVHLVFQGEFLDHFRATLGVGAVVLDDQLDGPPADAAMAVDVFNRRVGGAFVPFAVGRADARAVNLETEADRLVAVPRMGVGRLDQRARREAAGGPDGGRSGQKAGGFEGVAAGYAVVRRST